jgi:hypothetical protein
MHLREKWNKAYEIAKEKLSQEEYEWLEKARNDNRCPSANVGEELRQKLEAGKYTDEDGRKISIRDRIHKILKSIDKYANIVDVAVQHSPEIRSVSTQILYGETQLMVEKQAH